MDGKISQTAVDPKFANSFDSSLLNVLVLSNLQITKSLLGFTNMKDKNHD